MHTRMPRPRPETGIGAAAEKRRHQHKTGEKDMSEKDNEQAAQPTMKLEGVLVRLSHEELEQCKAKTGVKMAATAVAAFVRKNLRGQG